MVRTPKNVVVRAKDDPIGDLIVVAKKAKKVFWDENDWDRLALIVWKMKATSTDGLARIASLAQKQFPQNRQRPGILTVASLQPLVKRIKAMEEETREQAERAGQLAAQVTFFQGVPKTKQEIITSLTDDEIRQHFFGRFLAMLTIDDIGSTFSADQLVGALATADLAAVVTRRLVEHLEQPVQFMMPSQPAVQERRVVPSHNGNNRQPVPAVRQKKIVVIGTRGDEGRHIRDKVQHLCDVTFMEGKDLRAETVPRTADLVILWSKFISKHNRLMVLELLHSSKVFEHYFGAKELARKIESFCSKELMPMKAG
jgi:hypothetical protein